ncbi:MAG TPA: sterol desaturase family protein [Thermoleophilaceae bacterium]|nr:sterol desaturase family protein [Thermoleophilaceae bacterium]
MGVRLRTPDIKTRGEAWHVFSRKRAPRMLFGAVVLALIARLALGAFTWRDLVAVAAMLVIYPFGEWAIHVYLLHSKLDLVSTRSHMEHHADPQDLSLINFGPGEALAILLVAAPFSVGISALLIAPVPGPLHLEPFVTELLTAYVLIAWYEWIHFLIHTSYVPRSRWYKRVWRNHRLHHFKNEHYWHGITNTISDTVLRTNPDQKTVPKSGTARTLQGGGV